MSMKRSQAQTRSEGVENLPAKRRKAGQACASCRQHKTRCEILDFTEKGILLCHRCKVLGMECSFEASKIIHVPQSNGVSSPQAVTIVVNGSSPSPLQNKPPPPVPPPAASAIASPIPVLPLPPTEPRPSLHSAQDLRPEDLVPSPQVTMGTRYLPGTFDWSATPIQSIQELVSRYPHDQTTSSEGASPHSYNDTKLSDILTQDQINRLLEIFDVRYRPWMGLPSTAPDDLKHPLDLIACTIAARHLDPMTQKSVAPRLAKLTEETFVNQIFNPVPSTDAILGLLLMSLWAPLHRVTGDKVRDPRLLAASATSMAMNLGFWQSNERRMEEGGNASQEVVSQSRMWLIITCTESTICLATGRHPVSKRSDADRRVIDSSTLTPIERSRLLRLNYIANILDATEIGLRVRLQSPDRFPHFYDDMWNVFAKFDYIHTPLNPLHIVSDYDKFYYHCTLLLYHGWKLLVLHHALREMWRTMEGHNGQSWVSFDHQGHRIGMIWGRDATNAAQTVLTCLLTEQDIVLLAAAPDHVFYIITFAAVFLIVANFSVFHMKRGQHLGGACERLISMTIERLSQISHSPEHVPARCAHLIAELQGVWDRRGSEGYEGQVSWSNSFFGGVDDKRTEECNANVPLQQATPPEYTVGQQHHKQPRRPPPRPPGPNPHQQHAHSHSYQLPEQQQFEPPLYTEYTAGVGEDNVDIFNDPGFWASFMNNWNSDRTFH